LLHQLLRLKGEIREGENGKVKVVGKQAGRGQARFCEEEIAAQIKRNAAITGQS
jgi:hypothetical protein